MPGKALSVLAKRHRTRRERDARLDDAVRLWRKEFQRWERDTAAHPDKTIPRPSLRKFSKANNVDRTTLARHINNTQTTRTKMSGTQQKLSPQEEGVLIEAVIKQGRLGFPLTHDRVERVVNTILGYQAGTDSDVGKNWVDRFITRHEDQLHTYWTKHLPGNRAGAVNPTNIRSWEDIIEEEVVVPGIRPEDMYGMDETYMPPEFAQMRRVIAGKGKSIQYEQGGSSRQTITVLATICADGSTLPPNVIFKAARLVPEWFDDNVANATYVTKHFSHLLDKTNLYHSRITTSKNGWTDQNIAMDYLRVFDEQTRGKADGRTRVLFLDAHSSHDSVELVDNAHDKNIKILSYPSHTTHVLQGLDVVCFARLKEKHAEKIREFKDNNDVTLTHKFFLRTFGPAFLEAFTPETVKTAFSATGIYPFRRGVVLPEQMAPSEALTTNPSASGTLATPVRKVISAFSYYHSPASEDEQPTGKFPLPQVFADDMTPTKRARILYASLETSSSTSFLVSKPPIPASSINIHEPRYDKPTASLAELDFSVNSEDDTGMSKDEIKSENQKLRKQLKEAQKHIRARDQIIEADRAEMVIQNLTNRQLHASLFQKEESRKKKKNPTLNYASGRHVTSDESRAELRRLKDEREAKDMEKKERATARVAKRERRTVEGDKWGRAKKRHEVRLRKWRRVCDALGEEYICPPKPHRRLKADVLGGEPSSCESSEDESEEDMSTQSPSGESGDNDI